jgi:hypothetical protein
MAVLQTEKGPNWFREYLGEVERHFIEGDAEPGSPEPRGLLRQPEIEDPDPEC